MITASEALQLSSQVKKPEAPKWTILDTIRLKWLERLITIDVKKGNTSTYCWGIRPNVARVLEKKGFTISFGGMSGGCNISWHNPTT